MIWWFLTYIVFFGLVGFVLPQSVRMNIRLFNRLTLENELYKFIKKQKNWQYAVIHFASDGSVFKDATCLSVYTDRKRLVPLQNYHALEREAWKLDEDVRKTIELAVSCGSKHISMYALTVEDGTPIYTDYLNGELPDSDEVASLYEFGRKLLEEKGYHRYEVSNFAMDGFESKHNLNYWKRGEYIGVGVSASSFMRGKRFTNTFDLDEYMKCIISGFYPAVTSEDVSVEDAKFEYVMLAMRTKYGVNMQEYKEKFGTSLGDDFPNALKKTVKYLELVGDNLKIKDEFLYVQNSILVYFMEEER